MNTYCDDCKRCTGGNMRKSDVPGWDDHNRCWECEATIQAGMAEADAMISDLRAERDALRERCVKLEWLREVEAWRPPATHHNNGNGSGKRWFNSCQEYSATLQAALAAQVAGANEVRNLQPKDTM